MTHNTTVVLVASVAVFRRVLVLLLLLFQSACACSELDARFPRAGEWAWLGRLTTHGAAYMRPDAPGYVVRVSQLATGAYPGIVVRGLAADGSICVLEPVEHYQDPDRDQPPTAGTSGIFTTSAYFRWPRCEQPRELHILVGGTTTVLRMATPPQRASLGR